MHFIEQLFGISPDGDSGLTELLLFFGSAVTFLVVRWVHSNAKAGRVIKSNGPTL
jgi:hypothetical protein